MAVSASFLDYVLEQLAAVRAVSHRRMFGGVGVYSGDVFFAVIDNDTLFFKVDDTTRPEYERKKMPPFAPIPGQAPMRGYYQVPPAVLEDAEKLATWAKQAVAVAATASKRRRRKAR